jgi:16S rRNA processing protein RimM
MSMAEASYLAVARFARPHGLKGEAIVFVLTKRAEAVLVPGQALTPLDAAGRPAGASLMVERARPYHRRWLLKFEGIDERTPLESWPQLTLGVPDQGDPTDDGTGPLRDHEVPGASVLAHGRVIGTVRQVLEVPGGPLLVVDGDGREYLIPYRPPILVETVRERREIVVDPPPGLLEL